MARRFMADERRNHSLQATALVNEAYIRLAGTAKGSWKDRSHFLAFYAGLMRHILVDWARMRRARRRGGQLIRVRLEDIHNGTPALAPDLIDLDNAINALARFDERKSKVVELQMFGGFGSQETANILKISPDTVSRDMNLSLAWLRSELTGKNRRVS